MMWDWDIFNEYKNRVIKYRGFVNYITSHRGRVKSLKRARKFNKK